MNTIQEHCELIEKKKGELEEQLANKDKKIKEMSELEDKYNFPVSPLIKLEKVNQTSTESANL